VVDFLSTEEIDAVLSAPDQATFSGRRDAVMLRTFYNTGARVSEIIRIHRADLRLDDAHVLIHGKGRKERTIPLWKTTVRQLGQWIGSVGAEPDAPVFPNRRGGALSRVGVANRVQLAVEHAAEQCPTLRGRRVSPHVLRHTTAMHLLQSGVDITVIALWLGHESPTTTHRYVEADLAMKQRALSHLQSPAAKATRYRPGDRLLAFLEGL
jgi:site-specific recombinase XerD